MSQTITDFATGARGAIAVNPPEAADIGAQIFEKGGNAFDAAVAAAIACCMLRPDQTGVGGFACCAVALDAKTGKVWSIDANAVAPAAAHADMFAVRPRETPGPCNANELEYDCSVRDNANVLGPLAVAVPGMMAGMGATHERFGRLPWAQIVEPAIELIDRGFPFGPVAKAVERMQYAIDPYPATRAHLMPQGRLPRSEDIWHRPDMARTLARVAKEGWRDFYDGETGQAIADHIQQLGGILTRDDMAGYHPRFTEPYTAAHNGATVHTVTLTNGGITVLQLLNILEAANVSPDGSRAYWHAHIEALKLAWRDRLKHIADPDFADVPVAMLLSADFAARRAERLLREPDYVDNEKPAFANALPRDTLHISAADAEGNLVAMTITQGFAFGSCVTVPGTGVILGHGMCRLDPRPGLANSIAPRKRPVNNMCPVIVRTAGRDVAAGVPGGRKIVSVMARAAHMLAHGASIREVTHATRTHLEGYEPAEIQSTFDATVRAELEAMGHTFQQIEGICGSLNIAEYRKADGALAASGNISAAGV